MTYMIISDDEAATMRIVPAVPTHDKVLNELKNMGYNRVYPNRVLGVAGWLSDVGNVMPEFNRNIVGSCTMLALGAPGHVLGGPLVVTGYEFPHPGEEEMGFPEPMSEGQIQVVAGIYVGVLTALGMPVAAEMEQFRKTHLTPEQWLQRIRVDAQLFRDAPRPGLTVNGAGGYASPTDAATAIVDLIHGRTRGEETREGGSDG